MAYFLIAVSNRHNLELCMRYGLAGFTDSASGLWTFVDIEEGDFVSFLYGARVYNLYRVVGKAAYKDAKALPPWPSLTLKPSGRTYWFPFRLELECLRSLEEPLVRAEFAYVAENLLLRGGYRKTHFQADQTTLQAVSEMGLISTTPVQFPPWKGETFTPELAASIGDVSIPRVFLFRELFIQALVRKHLSAPGHLVPFLESCQVTGFPAHSAEVLSEKAFPEGHVDILIKEAAPKGISRKVVIEVKKGRASAGDIQQLLGYRSLLGEECLGAILICAGASSKVVARSRDQGVTVAQYAVEFQRPTATFNELLRHFRLTPCT